MTAPREAIYQALFKLVLPLQGLPQGKLLAPKPFRLVTRTIKEVQRIDPADQPILMMYEWNEETLFQGTSLSSKKWTTIFIIGATHPPDVPGSTILNPLADAVEAALLPPNPQDDEQTLGGLVTRVVVKGTAAKDHGDNSTKTDQRQSAYYLPVEIILPNS